MSSRLITIALGLCTVGCAPSASVALDLNTFDLVPDNECLIDVDAPRSTPFLVDLDVAEGGLAVVMEAALTVSDGVGAWAYIGEPHVFVQLDNGAPLQGVPHDDNTARTSSFGSIFNSATFTASRIAGVVVIDPSEIVALRAEPAVVDALVTTDARLAMTATVTFTGQAVPVSGTNDDLDDDDTRVALAIEPTPIDVAIELCRGCLATCEPDGAGTCFLGVDTAARCAAP